MLFSKYLKVDLYSVPIFYLTVIVSIIKPDGLEGDVQRFIFEITAFCVRKITMLLLVVLRCSSSVTGQSCVLAVR